MPAGGARAGVRTSIRSHADPARRSSTSPLDGLQPGERADELALAVAVDAGEADDLAARTCSATSSKLGEPEKPRSSSATGAAADDLVTRGEDSLQLAADDQRDDLLLLDVVGRGSVPRVLPSRRTVRRSAIALHLREPVRDVDDPPCRRPPARARARTAARPRARAAAAVGSSRISTRGSQRERLRQLDEVALGHRQVADAPQRIDLRLHRRQLLARPRGRRAAAAGAGRAASRTRGSPPRSGPAAAPGAGRRPPARPARRVPATGSSSRKPAISTLPSSGACEPAAIAISVDLPAPFSPSSACTSPGVSSKLTRLRATTPGKRFVHVASLQAHGRRRAHHLNAFSCSSTGSALEDQKKSGGSLGSHLGAWSPPASESSLSGMSSSVGSSLGIP